MIASFYRVLQEKKKEQMKPDIEGLLQESQWQRKDK